METLASTTKLKDLFTDAARGIICCIGILMMLGGALILLWQIYLFFKTGEWIAYPTMLPVLAVAPHDIALWFKTPTDWFGLHKVITGILGFPVSVTAFFTGIGLILYVDNPT